ncbi:MAG TPA: hypothetical protein VMA75_04305 [Candidatus Paceibacterota bacterium]|nr:hypothetical protein [Candidatus Paceibacterota bacterium]
MFEDLLSPANVIGRGDDLPSIADRIRIALTIGGGSAARQFAYQQRIPHPDRSLWVVGIGPFEKCVPFSPPVGVMEFARKLLRYSDAQQREDRARYPSVPASFAATATKGWTISRSPAITDQIGNPLIAAYASWIDPRSG